MPDRGAAESDLGARLDDRELAGRRPELPDEPLRLYGPGTDSGTFDYFTGAIVGEEGESRADYQASEDDNVTLEGVSGDKGGLDTSASPTSRKTRTR